MTFRPQAFRAQMEFDGARPNLFQVILNMPAAGFAGQIDVTEKLAFMCRAAQLPGSSIGVIPMSYFGRTSNFAGNRTFADWTITIINDEDFKVRNAIEKWMNAINSHDGNIRNPAALRNSIGTGSTGYTSDAIITQYSKLGFDTPIKRFKIRGLWPTDLSPIDLDWASNDMIEEFAVTFSYQEWVTEGLSGVPSGAITTT
jgi:hypothetical protein